MASNNAQRAAAAGDPRDAHIPCALNAPALLISSASMFVDTMPTIFVGIVDNDYSEAHWQDHCRRIKRLFGITDDLVAELKVNNRGDQKVDGEKLALDMQTAVTSINQHSFDKLRIVRMGIGNSIAMDLALEALIRGWNLPPQNKYIQLVALGDTSDQHCLNFCKMLCLKEFCNTVQYYNTMDYNDYGYIDPSSYLLHQAAKHQRSGNRTQEDPTGTRPDD